MPALRLAQRCGLYRLVGTWLRLPGSVDGTGAFAAEKVATVLMGMLAGADSITDMARLRHAGMGGVFTAVRAPSTLGSFLRSFSHGHVGQLQAVARRFLPELAAHTPLLPGAGEVAYLDVDDTVKPTYGYTKQGAGYGYTKVKGLNALLATLSTPIAAPVVAATRLRRGATSSARGAASFVGEAVRTARACGAVGLLVVRADSAFYAAEVIGACRALGARFSVTARMNPSVRAAISRIDEDAWTPIKYPQAVWDEEGQCWISDAEIAEIGYTAFTSKPARQQVHARLIVRRVKRLNPGAGTAAGSRAKRRAADPAPDPEQAQQAQQTPQTQQTQQALQALQASGQAAPAAGQGELFQTYRYHAVFTDSTLSLPAAEADHRRHAIVEQVITQLKASALAHLPSSDFQANAAWLVLTAMAHNLTRAVGALASPFHAKARTTTIRDELIHVPARVARSGGRLVLHLAEQWHTEDEWTALFDAVHHVAVQEDAVHDPPRAA